MSTDKTRGHKHLTDEELIGLQSKDKTEVSRKELWSHLEDCDTCFTKFTLFGASLDNVRQDKDHFKDITPGKFPGQTGTGVQEGVVALSDSPAEKIGLKSSTETAAETSTVPWNLLGLNQKKWMVTAAFAASVLLILLIQPTSYEFTNVYHTRLVYDSQGNVLDATVRGSDETIELPFHLPELIYDDGDLQINWQSTNVHTTSYMLEINGKSYSTDNPTHLIKDFSPSGDTLYLEIDEMREINSEELATSSSSEITRLPISKIDLKYVIEN